MKLPHVEQAAVTREKVVEYLLNPLHADGAPKARFFTALGFRVEKGDELAAALRRVAEEHQVQGHPVFQNGEAGKWDWLRA
ncbi:MAG: hypothetical protein HYX69_21695 [Planctomycetia bacterium]|nr:hypothetical protein [Planctomycetia bacterium]